MRKWLILLSALFGTTATGAPAWTWVDADGTVHFSDRPEPGARQVELAGAQGFGSAGATRTVARATEQADSPAPYRVIDIVSPAEQETLRGIGSVMTVQVRFQPDLQPGHRYDVLFDGQRRNVNTVNPRVSLTEIFRGSHTLQIVVIDSAGTEVMRSPSRTFFVQQTSVQNPSSPLRPQAGAN
jgi:hypothetical protein